MANIAENNGFWLFLPSCLAPYKTPSLMIPMRSGEGTPDMTDLATQKTQLVTSASALVSSCTGKSSNARFIIIISKNKWF